MGQCQTGPLANDDILQTVNQSIENLTVYTTSNTELDCNLYTFIIYVGIFGAMCIFGIIGNTLSFIVLNTDRHSHAATFLLQTMAVVDNAFLLATAVSQILQAYSLYVGGRDHPLQVYVIKYVHPFVHITQLGTVWITVVISFNRYIAICQPFRAYALCSMKRVRLQVAIMLFSIVAYNIPRFCEGCIDYTYDPVLNQTVPKYRSSTLRQNVVYNVLYENILYCLFVFLGPLFVLVVLNTLLILELLSARQRLAKNQLSAKKGGRGSEPGAPKVEDQEQNITLVMVVIVLVFLFCQTPAYINQLLFYVLGEEHYQCGMAYYYYYHISNLIVSANSCLNFVIYCAFRRQFRQRLAVLCSRKGSTYDRERTDSVLLTGDGSGSANSRGPLLNKTGNSA